MSVKVVVPDAIISAAASRVPHLTKSRSTFLASAGKMKCWSQSMRSRSSAMPRKSVIGTCVCAFTKPGRMAMPRARIVSAPANRLTMSADLPTPTMSPLSIATAPSSIFGPAMVMTVPPVMTMSTRRGAAWAIAAAKNVSVRSRRRNMAANLSGIGCARTIPRMKARITHRATYADLEKVPENMVAELIDGDLYTSPRPAGPHADTSSVLGMLIGFPYRLGRGGPGGWWIVDEPEVHLDIDVEVLVPDLAGWRRERMPQIPKDHRFIIPPDWVCEVLSPSTARIDRGKKMRIYAEHGVPWMWILDPLT